MIGNNNPHRGGDSLLKMAMRTGFSRSVLTHR